MKTYLALPILLLALALGAGTAFAQSLKIGTVDMKRIFDSYYKTKDAESKINEARNAAKKELEDRMDIAKKAVDEVKKLDEEISNAALSKDAKEQKQKLRSEWPPEEKQKQESSQESKPKATNR